MAVKKYDISIGDLRRTVTFFQNTPVTNNSGGPQDNYSPTIVTRCQLVNTSGNRMMEDGQIIFQDSWQMITRYRGDLYDSINSDTRCGITGDDGIYVITSFNLTDQTKHFIAYNLIKSTPSVSDL